MYLNIQSLIELSQTKYPGVKVFVTLPRYQAQPSLGQFVWKTQFDWR